jgi:hypothetical protein
VFVEIKSSGFGFKLSTISSAHEQQQQTNKQTGLLIVCSWLSLLEAGPIHDAIEASLSGRGFVYKNNGCTVPMVSLRRKRFT